MVAAISGVRRQNGIDSARRSTLIPALRLIKTARRDDTNECRTRSCYIHFSKMVVCTYFQQGRCRFGGMIRDWRMIDEWRIVFFSCFEYRLADLTALCRAVQKRASWPSHGRLFQSFQRPAELRWKLSFIWRRYVFVLFLFTACCVTWQTPSLSIKSTRDQ